MRRHRLVLVLATAAVMAAVAVCRDVDPGWAQAPPADDPEPLIARIAASTERPAEGGFLLQDAPDAGAPATLLHGVLAGLDRLCAGSPDPCALTPKATERLAAARRHFEAALRRLAETTPALSAVIADIRDALADLAQLDRPRVRPFDSKLDAAARAASGAARRIASRLVDVATAAGGARVSVDQATAALGRGDLAVERGNFVLAVFFFGQALGFAADVPLVFDIGRFEQNIRDALEDQTIGHAYAIVLNGVLHAAEPEGLARNATDGQQAQSPTKEMYIASMTKTISAVALLKLLADHGILVEDSIASHLPPDWTQGPNLDQVTFRRLLTHRSGLDAAGVSDQSLQSLRDVIEAGSTGASDGQPSVYTNANFGLLRILIPQIAHGEDVISAYANVYPLDAVYAGLYASVVTQNVFEPAGIAATVPASDEAATTRTRLYRLGSPDDSGLDPGDWSLFAGATGWYLSTVELARFLGFLRFTEAILDAETRDLMDELFLGWLDPVAFGAYVSGTFADYRAHGGDYPLGDVPGMTGCMMNFHINVQASLLINSRGGNLGGHACTLLRDAFDGAWVAP